MQLYEYFMFVEYISFGEGPGQSFYDYLVNFVYHLNQLFKKVSKKLHALAIIHKCSLSALSAQVPECLSSSLQVIRCPLIAQMPDYPPRAIQELKGTLGWY